MRKTVESKWGNGLRGRRAAAPRIHPAGGGRDDPVHPAAAGAAGVGARRGPQGRAAREGHFVATRNVPKCLHGRGEAGRGGARARLCGLTEGGSRRHASAVREGGEVGVASVGN